MPKLLVLFAVFALFTTPVVGQSCAVCEQIVNFIENWAENNASLATIEQYLEIVCTLAPATWQQPCDAIVDYGVEAAIQWVETNENATQLCSQLQLCSSPKTPLKKLNKAPVKNVGDNCAVCEQVVGLIENWIESNYTVQEITQYLDQVCSLIPGFSQVCDQVVTYGIGYIVTYIQNDENATQICAQLGLCGGAARVQPAILAMKAERQDQCSLCTQFFTLLKGFIGNNGNATVQELEQFAQTICNLLPQYSTICVALADNEISSIITELEGNNGPQAVCTTLGLCSSKKPVANAIPVA